MNRVLIIAAPGRDDIAAHHRRLRNLHGDDKARLKLRSALADAIWHAHDTDGTAVLANPDSNHPRDDIEPAPPTDTPPPATG